jgi:septum formation protein
MEIILASSSPRRKQIMSDLGLSFRIVVPNVDEVHWHHDPTGMVRENAVYKCSAVAPQHPNAITIAADTIVVFNGKSIGKPRSPSDARAMLQQFSGKTQTVHTGTAISIHGHRPHTTVTTSKVHFRKFDAELIERYFKLIDPMDRAGAYDINEYSELIIESYEGSRTNIMGLPREVLIRFMEKLRCKLEH